MRRKKRSSAMLKKIVVMFAAVVLIVTATISGTLAWLTAETQEVTNTFTVGNVEISLTEHKLEDGSLSKTETSQGNEYHFVPGDVLPKDPYVTVGANSESCYVFVVIEEKNNTITVNGSDEKIVQYSTGSNWALVSGTENVYCYVDKDKNPKIAALGDKLDEILEDNQVTISDKVTKSYVETVKESQNEPELNFKAYAIQSDNLKKDGNTVTTAADIWALVKDAESLT